MSTSPGNIQRPILLIVLVIVSALVGVVATGMGLYLIVAGLSDAFGPMGQLGALLGAMVFVLGVFELLVAYGLWKLRMWGWWLGVNVHSLMAALVIMTIFTSDQEVFGLYLLVAGLLAFVACLFVPQVRRAFRPVA